MEQIVVDSSVAIKWFVVEDHTPEARAILAKYKTQDSEFVALDLINVELANILWKKQLRKMLSGADATVILADFLAMSITLVPGLDLLQDAYRLATVYKTTVYDSLYLALSEREGCRFVTADEEMYKQVHTSMRNVVLLANWS